MVEKKELIEKAKKCVYSNDFHQAHEYNLEACKLFPDDAECHYWLAELYRAWARESPLLAPTLSKNSLKEYKKVWDLDMLRGLNFKDEIIEVLVNIAASEDDDNVILILEQISQNNYSGNSIQTVKMLMEKYC